MGPKTKTRSDLLHNPALVLPPAHLHALKKPIHLLDTHLPGLFTSSEPPSGVELLSFNFVRGMLYGSKTAQPKYLYAVHKGELPDVNETDGISIVSGICLFGSGGLLCYGKNGVPTVLDRPGVTTMKSVPKILSVQRTTTQIYIPEAIARLGRTMVALSQLAKNVYQKPVSIYIHVPGPEYKLTAEAVYAYGGITLEALRAYYTLVDIEVAEITERFSSIFRYYRLPQPVFGSPLDDVVAAYEPGGLALQHFERASFETGITAINLSSIKEVSHHSETAAYRRAIKPGDLPVFVDDYDEWKIFKYAADEPDFRGIALYPLPLHLSKHTQLFYYNSASPDEIIQAISPWA